MEFFKTNSRGIALCLAIAVPAWILGTFFPIVGRSLPSFWAC